ncbi:phage tail protein [Flavihumibacter solisilvae]|uniref:Phage tail protein n=1 Tax=Flavihumibacter solisilvae TaxID=1349421 RepID=A0A0C1IMB6_9BACT|nr:phage tail protein [Flavihumibacter solisilvae]KIC95400.1 phage tail protein [Flavihumibacter solisilvae]
MASYPIPVFYFKVSWNNQDIGFSDVSGLTQEIQAIEYRDGLTGHAAALKIPGIPKVNNIILKRGIVQKNNDLFNWFNNNGAPNVERRDIIITLLNDEGAPVMIWTISQAFPVKCEGPGLKATGNEIAIESIELTHEGISLKTA